MKNQKTIQCRFNDTVDEATEFSIGFDNWEFTGSVEECLEQISDLFNLMRGGIDK